MNLLKNNHPCQITQAAEAKMCYPDADASKKSRKNGGNGKVAWERNEKDGQCGEAYDIIRKTTRQVILSPRRNFPFAF